jgi:hypothetical protein
MKKVIVIFLLSISVIGVTNGQFTKIGGGLGLTSGFYFHEQTTQDANKSGKIALSLKGIYEISVPFHISPSFSYFYPNITKYTQFNENVKTTVSSMMFDINGHYVFNSLDKFEFYGIAGIDILLAWKRDVYKAAATGQTVSDLKESDNALGLNIGGGTYMKITETLDIYGELKYLFNNKYNQFMLNAGVLLNIDWMKKNENPGL